MHFLCPNSVKSVICLRFTQNTIRGTGATLLSKHKYGFEDAQIMSNTGHKSVVTNYVSAYRYRGYNENGSNTNRQSSPNQAALPSTAMIALPSTSGIENIPPGAILQDLVPVNRRTDQLSLLVVARKTLLWMNYMTLILVTFSMNSMITQHKSKTVKPVCRQIHRFSMAMLLLSIILPLISNS